jgi:DNA polymerase III sliding clamp (beta) subunit (PCNA family)
MRRCMTLATDMNRSCIVRYEGGDIVVSIIHPELGAANVTVPCESENAEAFEFTANVSYMAEALAAITSETVAMEWREPGAAIVFRPTDGSDYLNLVMPMRK